MIFGNNPMITSKQAVDLAAAIYDPIDESKFDTVIKIAGVTVGVKNLGDVTVFSFAGSEKTLDFLRDSFIIPEYHPGVGVVATGFMVGMDSIFESLLSYLHEAKSIAITGHSLGCSHGLILAGLCFYNDFAVASLDLFAPPKTSYSYLKGLVKKCVPTIRAYHNGLDPVPTIPLGHDWAQYDLIHLHEEPQPPWHLDPVRWHMIDLYKRGIEKLNDEK